MLPTPQREPIGFFSTCRHRVPTLRAVRACVIFNPAAKGRKAKRFFANLDAISQACMLLRTTTPNQAQELAAAAIADGFDTIIAAGGDGTINEVLNGFGQVGDGFNRARLGILPLGTVNVFAREIGVPRNPTKAWEIIQAGREIRVDLPFLSTSAGNGVVERHFVQLGGCGLDASAIERVSGRLKQRIGPLAYVVAGLQALMSPRPKITVTADDAAATGELVLLGNGRRYGGEFQLFPEASLNDGLVEICVFPKASWSTLLRCAPPLLLKGRLPESAVIRMRTKSCSLRADTQAAFEVEGELGGHLPATLSIRPSVLRVIVP